MQFNIGIGNTPDYTDPNVQTLNSPGAQLGKGPTAVACILIGLIFAVAGFFVYKGTLIPASYVHTTGQVTQEAPVYDTRSANGYQQQTTSYAPIIKFSAAGQTYSFQSNSSHYPPTYAVGQSVDVAYNPTSPGVAAKNASDKATPYLGPILAAVGSVLVVFGIFTALKAS